MAEKVNQSDFIEIVFSGYANGQLFDSNIPEDLKKLDPKAEPQKTIICVGQNMIVPGLDKQLVGKDVGVNYELEVKTKDGFGERNRSLIRVIPLKAFSEQKIHPAPGMMFTLDNSLVKIIAVSGARVTVDFNNPLAGKDLVYKLTILRKVEDTKEKSETLFKLFLRFVPEFEIRDKVVVKGPKILESMTKVFNETFKELVGKELDFEESRPKNENSVQQTEA